MSPPSPAPRPPVFVLLFFSIFGFIGIAVLVFLWGPGDDFGEPPLFFRIMGSLIALGFMAMGFGVPLSALRRSRRGAAPPEPSEPHGDYRCPNCGANVRGAEVSPSGDVKCPYCRGWWNIHRR